jgi:carbonic anhydrase/acetyltransferase-like protein (isoleucine patch superfamily)
MNKLFPSRVFLAIGLCFSLVLATAPARAAESVQARGNLDIPRGREVGDVVVADGNVRIGGTVLGSVYVAAGDVLLAPGARVQGSLTVIGGDAWVSAGARVDKGVYVFAGQAHLEEGAQIAGEVQVVGKSASLTPQKIALVSRYLLLDRVVPGPSFSLEQLANLDLAKLHLRKTSSEKVAYLDLGKLGKRPLEFREVLDARELRADRARITVIKFINPAAAEGFWDSLRELPEDQMSNSVHSSLGEGAHWYFRYSGRADLLWTRDQYLIAIQSGYFHDDHFSPDQRRPVERSHDSPRTRDQHPAAHENGRSHDDDHLLAGQWGPLERTRDQVRQALEALFRQSSQPELEGGKKQ